MDAPLWKRLIDAKSALDEDSRGRARRGGQPGHRPTSPCCNARICAMTARTNRWTCHLGRHATRCRRTSRQRISSGSASIRPNARSSLTCSAPRPWARPARRPSPALPRWRRRAGGADPDVCRGRLAGRAALRPRFAGPGGAGHRPGNHHRTHRHQRDRTGLGRARGRDGQPDPGTCNREGSGTTPPGPQADPVLLEVFNNLFMSVADQMGATLANTSWSVNIKERYDFSCAIFDDPRRSGGQRPACAGASGVDVRCGQNHHAAEPRCGAGRCLYAEFAL